MPVSGRLGTGDLIQPISTTYSGSQGFRYRAARPDEYLVKSGMGVKNEIVVKNTFQWPFQRVTVITLAPRNFSFTLHCISRDLVPFDLPVVFTIGPYDPIMDMNGFLRYASKMSAMTGGELQEVVLGVIHGQVRVYAAGLTVMEMFADRDSFKMHVQERIAKELISFGLQVFNGNVAEMRDSEGNAYFFSLKQKAISKAVNEARVETATAKRMGDIGESERQAEAKIRIAEISAQVTEAENVRQQQIAKSKLDLELVNLRCKEEEEVRRVAAVMLPKTREAELQIDLNKIDAVRQQTLLESTDLARVIVDAAITVKKADASALAKRTLADADLYSEQQRALGIKAAADAQAKGLQSFLSIAEPELVKFYLAVDRGLFEKLAQRTADAIQGLNPSIHVWNTGGEVSGSGDPFASIRNLFMSLPPMLDAIQHQTNIKLPGIPSPE